VRATEIFGLRSLLYGIDQGRVVAVGFRAVDVRAALRATLVANAYLEAEVVRLTEAISTGFVRERIRKPPSKSRR